MRKPVFFLFLCLTLFASVCHAFAAEQTPLPAEGSDAPRSPALRVESDDGPQITAYRQAHPEIRIEDVRLEWDGVEGLADFLTASDTSPDVFLWVAHGSYFPALKERGHLADLSANAFVREQTQSYYPFLREALEGPNGEIYAAPIELWVNAWTIDESAWRESTGKPLPTTFLDLLDALSAWNNEDYRLIEMDFYTKNEWLYHILRYYNLQHFRSGAALSYENRHFLDTLQALKQLEFKEELRSNEYYEWKPAVIYPYCYRIGERATVGGAPYAHLLSGAWITPPLVDPADEPRVFAQVNAYAVNSASKQTDRAMQFIDFVARYSGKPKPENTIMMSPEANDPILSKYYLSMEQKLLPTIADLESRLPDANAEDAAQMRARIDELRGYLANDSGKWDASSEDIAQYRRIAPYLTFGNGIPVYEGDPLFQQLFNHAMRYLEGAAPLEPTIEAMNRVALDAFDGQIR